MAKQTRIKTKRVYVASSPSDGKRFLIDRVWPRGVKKEKLKIEEWVKQVAPSSTLRKWFGHAPERWDEFCRRYSLELDDRPEAWQPLLEVAQRGTITLVYGARDEEHNNAVALKDYLKRHLR